MTPVLTQMGILVFIMAVGFFCTKIGVTGPEFTRSGSKVVLNVLLVFTILDSVSSAGHGAVAGGRGPGFGGVLCAGVYFCGLGLLTAKLIRARTDRRGIAAFA